VTQWTTSFSTSLTLQRNGLTFGLPKYLRVVDHIQRAVLGPAGAPTGDYYQFAPAAEGAQVPLAALDEHGLPLKSPASCIGVCFREGPMRASMLSWMGSVASQGRFPS
jgi:hypothetical protein